MITYVGRRLLSTVPLLVGVLTLVFTLVELVPGDPFSQEAASGVRPEAAERLRQAFGVDRPLWQRYLGWLTGFLTADLGISFSLRRPVLDLLVETLGNTLALAGLAVLLQFLLGATAGIAAVSARSRWADRAITGAASVGYSVPSFWLGLVLVWLFSVRAGWLPVSQMHSVDASTLNGWNSFLDFLRHLVLPCLSLTLPPAAGIALYVREEMEASLDRGFIRTARARGVAEKTIVLKHGLGNALLPLITLFGLALPGIVGGSVVIEVLFAWPGMGRLAYQAVLARDGPLILGCTWVASVLVIAGSLAADLLSALADPRVRESLR